MNKVKNKHAQALGRKSWLKLTKEEQEERIVNATKGYLTYFSKLSPEEKKTKMERMRMAKRTIKTLTK